MSDVSTAAEQAAPETPASEPEVKTPATETTDPGEGDPEAKEAAPVVDEFDSEIEFDGEKFKVPKKLKDGFLMQSDYTKKTQEVAETRKALVAQQEAVKQQAEMQEAHVKDVGRVLAINDQIAEYDKIDIRALNETDPFKAMTLFQERTTLKEKRDGLIAEIQANETRRSQETQQAFAKRYAETNDALEKDIPGYNSGVAEKLRAFAMTNGATDADIRSMATNVPLVKMLHMAYLGHQLVTAKTTEAKSATPKVEPKPLTKVGGAGARVAGDLTTADMETYVALRKKQGFGKR